MAKNKIELKKIIELTSKELNFYIPSYQRGYRWTDIEVLALLNDINEFEPKSHTNVETGNKTETFYCLQPVVVKYRDDKKWEVIDGQQRLTTIYLILNYLNQGYIEARRKKLFSLEYQTRSGSSEYLKNELGKNSLDVENIDYYHISNAYDKIGIWFNNKEEEGLNTNKFESKIVDSVKVIWYEVIEVNAIDIFTRINMGKIPLTNAELVKALFLNSSNFISNNSSKNEKTRLTQLQIAGEWDRMEYALQEDALWYFLTNEDKKDTRIEFVLKLLVNYDTNNEELEKRYNDDFGTFFYFSDRFEAVEKNKDAIYTIWQEIKQCFQKVDEWYSDRNLYHKIGYLVAIKHIDIRVLLYIGGSKAEFRKFIDKEINKSLKNVVLEELEYENKNIDKIRKVLLLHNVLTMLGYEKESYRFPFNRYKTHNDKQEKWNIEHIYASAEEIPIEKEHKDNFLHEALKYIDNPALKGEIENYLDGNDFDTIYKKVINHFSDDEGSNHISNLALLDEKTNKGYGNAFFPSKRQIILSKEKEGKFIPVCTKNVFMKVYSNDVSQMYFWGKNDKDAYFDDMKEKLAKYL